ncbi:MAG: DUF3078 domain-containing protein [Bacteroidota bacterium]
MNPNKITLTVLAILTCFHICLAQEIDMEALKKRKESLKLDVEEWTLDIKEAQAELVKIKREIKVLEDSLKVYPIWSTGVLGTLGFNFTRFQNWLSKNQSSTSASTLGYNINAFFNLQQKKYFWKNSININQSWLRFDNKDIEEENSGYQVASDAFNGSSLWGFKFSEKLATSALLEYRSALLQGRWNNPGFLDVGIGLSWTPKKDLAISIHPLNYNQVFSNSEAQLSSSLGLKMLGEYSKKFASGISWTSNLSSFFSYKSGELNNWLWINGLSKKFGALGVGLNIAIKQNQQEAKARELDENPFQYYYILGLSFKF